MKSNAVWETASSYCQLEKNDLGAKLDTASKAASSVAPETSESDWKKTQKQ